MLKKAKPTQISELIESSTLSTLIKKDDKDTAEKTEKQSHRSELLDNTPSTTAAQSQKKTANNSADGGIYGGDNLSGGSGGNNPYIPVVPANREIVATGEKITDSEAAKHLAENKKSIASALNASGVNADNIRFSEKGYCHVSYYGKEGEQLEVRENFRDYLAYNGDELIAVITLVKENGRLYNTPAFGAPWFKEYNDILKSCKGKELLYIYAGFAEIILTPDGKILAPSGSGINPEIYMQGIKDPYHVFYHPSAIYIP
ncbi:MAG: hypothetical protein IJU45_02195 [Clostridia bacterium]|nr:hypothetical protein [Clostridia bacterium]